MTEIEKMKRYIERTKMDKNSSYQMNFREMLEIEFAFPPPPLVSGFVDIDVLDELVNASQQIFICDFAQHVRNQADCLSVLVYVV